MDYYSSIRLMSADNGGILIKLEGREFKDAERIECVGRKLDSVCSGQIRLELPAQRRIHKEYFGI